MANRRTIITRDVRGSIALGRALDKALPLGATQPDRTLTAEMIDSYLARVCSRASSVSHVRKRFGTNLGALLARCKH